MMTWSKALLQYLNENEIEWTLIGDRNFIDEIDPRIVGDDPRVALAGIVILIDTITTS
jgi:hypothetical protein